MLYGDLTVGDSELYANEPNKEITAMITTAHDLDFGSKKPQIVLETLTDYAEQDKKVYYNIKNHGACKLFHATRQLIALDSKR